MGALSFRNVLAAAVTFGFIGGWTFGMFLGLWAWVTLGM